MREERAKFKRLSIWFCLNLVIFVTCYLNYRLQLKHRYLYKTLNVGLCFSRAAAMVINFNLLLVWLPMCKYSLTRLACLATSRLGRLKQERQTQVNLVGHSQERSQHSGGSKMRRLTRKFKSALDSTRFRLRLWLIESKITTINSFLISVDHCTSLHTICATTITIASVLHTLAHLMNVINFSRNFDPLLDNLNMAEYKGQNPLQLLVSVPGITGSLMIIILILMSLSSVDIIRNSSYDLFQIFHRLSVIFVILLFLHPFSHVLKEQSNVERHHPDFCYDKMTAMLSNTNLSSPQGTQGTLSYNLSQIESLPAFASKHHENIDHQGRHKRSSTTRGQHNSQTSVNNKTTDLSESRNGKNNEVKATSRIALTKLQGDQQDRVDILKTNSSSGGESEVRETITLDISDKSGLCLDLRPLFVAQSSICWYVLSAGLSCYILDLLLRKWRRAKSPIQLLGVRLDCEGNLIELILSNNHKRFAHWLPGQFVYLNCPQIATYEWHPFTISSMDNNSRQFTLHIKTGGDWTRKLRKKLEQRKGSSMSLLSAKDPSDYLIEMDSGAIVTTNLRLDNPILPNLDCYSKKGELQIECTKVSPIAPDNEKDCLGISSASDDLRHQQVYSVCGKPLSIDPLDTDGSTSGESLSLYVDGPFHSPFERLLEQQVSVCIASGVGWTAFSSVFQCITNNFNSQQASPKDWWTQWRKFYLSPSVKDDIIPATNVAVNIRKLSDTKLHLMVIVTSIEQLKPFYYLALNYFQRISSECQLDVGSRQSPVQGITAFITRSTKGDSAVQEFCLSEKIATVESERLIRVNEVFTIHFGKPNFELLLGSFSNCTEKKISVYCCGSYLVRKTVQEVCHNLNKMYKCNGWPFYSYHEESF